jgi:hypothetical protein
MLTCKRVRTASSASEHTSLLEFSNKIRSFPQSPRWFCSSGPLPSGHNRSEWRFAELDERWYNLFEWVDAGPRVSLLGKEEV